LDATSYLIAGASQGLVSVGDFKLSALWGQPGGMLNTMTGLVFVTALQAASVFMMKQFFESIPREVEEAAAIDGANHWNRFARVVLPMARPALGAVVILQFQGAWNEFFWSFIVLTSPEQVKTLPIGLLSFRNTYGGIGDWGLILAGAVLSALPVIVLFFVFQRYFLEGVSFGGGKE
jgi:multiple sugar transport system permease protein